MRVKFLYGWSSLASEKPAAWSLCQPVNTAGILRGLKRGDDRWDAEESGF